jgi:2-iminobutanoate/2-iminopropanoate deaminase
MRHHVRLVAAAAGAAGLLLGIAGSALLTEHPSAQARTERKSINPAKGPQTGLPFSPGILAGNTLYISGHLAQDPVATPRRIVTGGIDAETRQIMSDIREVLKAAGMDFSDVASVNVYMTHLDEFDRFNAIYREFFPADPPARTTVGVAGLNLGARVEIQMTAVKR